ncbi:hypothetical protein CC2G_011176 [Coprinopsis cinerea AmutBmut pab1-1]|nr:hypothetical protein CC2G_011176 [Coprinopsis cinerea AmutBmut pab1-1]
MLRLSRSDGIGASEFVPALCIRLNCDQASYDFIKWYATISFGEGYDWENVSLPFLDLKDEDILESPSVVIKALPGELSLAVPLLPIKV